MSEIAKLIFGAALGLSSSATVAFALWSVNVRTAVDREARELHKDLTTGAGAEARAALSAAEYAWWKNGVLPFEGSGESFQCTDAELFERFYAVSAAVDRLSMIVVHYHPRYSRCPFRRSARYRLLLGWHLAIHIAWAVWFIGAASAVPAPPPTPTPTPESNPVVVPPRLLGASSRIKIAIKVVGNHRTGTVLDSTISSSGQPESTVKEYAAGEIKAWIASTTGNSVEERVLAARLYADWCNLSVSDD